jgi:sirohydrochlorin cobaltochelatase
MISASDSALLIVGHGSTVNPDSSAPTLAHAAEIRRRNIFGDVACAFWKEEPSLRDAIFLFDPDTIKNVCVVPNFISEGYFTQTVIPRELELNGRVTQRDSGQIWNYGEPVGNHPLVTELLVQRARDIAPGIPEIETSLLIVAHGTDLNENSAVAAKREAERIRALGRYANVLNVYMEEFPLFRTASTVTKTFRFCSESSMKDRHRLRNGKATQSFGRSLTRSIIARCFMRARSGLIRGWPILSSSRRPQRLGQTIQ